MRGGHTYYGLEDFARRAPADHYAFVREFDVTLKKLAAIHLSAGMQIRAPVDTGELLGSMRLRLPTSADQHGVIEFAAAYAAIYMKGRRRSKPYRRQVKPLAEGQIRGRRGQHLGSYGSVEFTRMLGSRQPQAREGMLSPALKQLKAEWNDVVTEAAQRVAGSGVAEAA